MNYSRQFDFNWQLANKGEYLGKTLVEDCSLDELIEATFGERGRVPSCPGGTRRSHEIKRSEILLDIEQFGRPEVAVLDVACGHALPSELGAKMSVSFCASR